MKIAREKLRLKLRIVLGLAVLALVKFEILKQGPADFQIYVPSSFVPVVQA